MMQLNLESIDVEQGERTYIKEEGEFTLKVVKVTEGTTSNQNQQIKVHFQDKHGRFAIDEFVITQNALWKIKLLSKALKLPNVIDTNMFLERYVKATIKTKNTQGGGVIYEIKKYEQSPLTNTYEAPQQQAYPAQQQQAPQTQTPEHKIDEDEIPF